MAQWFETKVRYDKTMENGSIKKVTEAYMVDALSFNLFPKFLCLPIISRKHTITSWMA